MIFLGSTVHNVLVLDSLFKENNWLFYIKYYIHTYTLYSTIL